jgi:hypothetical protein
MATLPFMGSTKRSRKAVINQYQATQWLEPVGISKPDATL